MSDRRILCVGMCVLDIIHVCAEFPEEDTDRRCQQGYWQRGGNASNNCTVLRQLGAKCEFLGMLSKSNAFLFLWKDCEQRGIDISNCPNTIQNPPFSSVILTQNTGSRTIIHSNSNFPILSHAHFERLNLHNYAWIHFEARNSVETSLMLERISAFNRNLEPQSLIITSLEVEKPQTELLQLSKYVDYVFIGKVLAGHMGWSSMFDAVHGLRLHTSAAIICTWGADGCCCLDSLNNYKQMTAETVTKIVDSLGAGDTFCAATIYALQQLKLQLPDAVTFGNRCAAFKLQRNGYDDIQNFK